MTTAITNAILIDGTGSDPVPNATVLVDDERITAAGVVASIPQEADVIDAGGRLAGRRAGCHACSMWSTDSAAAYCYITTRGRITGKPHTVEIWFALRGDTLFVLAGSGRRADFVRNAIKDPRVQIRIGTPRARLRAARARIVALPDEDARARRLLLEKYGNENEDLDEWGRTALPVAFDLT